VQSLPHKHRRIVDDSLVHWKPVQANKNRRDMVMAMSPGDQAGCRILQTGIAEDKHQRPQPEESCSSPLYN